MSTRTWTRTRGATALALTLALAGCGGSSAGSRTTAAPLHSTATPTPTPSPTPPEPSPTLSAIGDGCLSVAQQRSTFRLRTADGGRMAAVVLGAGPRAVLLAHQTDGSICQWFPAAEQFAAWGYRVMVVDFEGWGASTPWDASTTTPPLVENLTTATAWLTAHGVTSVVVVGASMGGTVAMGLAGARPRALRGAVALSGPAAMFEVDGVRAAARSTVPLLLVAAEDDASILAGSRAMAAAAKGRATLLPLSGSDHGVATLTGDPPVLPALRAFLGRTLGA